VAEHSSSSQFEVATIRPSRSGEAWRISITPDGFRAQGVPLARTIMKAYFPANVHDEGLIKGGPRWIWDSNYDIEAKVAQGDVPEWERQHADLASYQETLLQKMLKKLLVDRCNLVAHRVSSITDGYSLMVGRHGIDQRRITQSFSAPAHTDGMLSLPGGGWVRLPKSESDPAVEFFNVTMNSVSRWLAVVFGRPVQNSTGLLERYDFKLNSSYTDGQQDTHSMANKGNTADRIQIDNLNFHDLGLDLKPIRIPTEALVIDRIERPSEN